MKKTNKIKDAVDVVNRDGEHIRTYSKKVHGKDYKKLAEEFAKKVAGRKVVPASDKSVEKE